MFIQRQMPLLAQRNCLVFLLLRPKNLMAMPENFGYCQRLPLVVAKQNMRLLYRWTTIHEPHSALYRFQFVVR